MLAVRTAAARRWATHLGGSCSRNGRDSAGKRLGMKLFNGAAARPNDIIARQRGMWWRPGRNVGVGRDYTLHALVAGTVQYERNPVAKRTWIHVVPHDPNPMPSPAPGGFTLTDVSHLLTRPVDHSSA